MVRTSARSSTKSTTLGRNEVTPRTSTSASAATIGSSTGTRCSTCPNPATTNRLPRPVASPSRRTGTNDRKTMAAPAVPTRLPVRAATRKPRTGKCRVVHGENAGKGKCLAKEKTEATFWTGSSRVEAVLTAELDLQQYQQQQQQHSSQTI